MNPVKRDILTRHSIFVKGSRKTRSAVWFWIALAIMFAGLPLAIAIDLISAPHYEASKYTTADNSSIVQFDQGTVTLNGENLTMVQKATRAYGPPGILYALPLFLGGAVVLVWGNPRSPTFLSSAAATNLSIPTLPQGIIATRVWHVSREGYLTSTFASSVWPSCHVKADEIPGRLGKSGIYSYRLGKFLKWAFYPWQKYACGILSLSGHCVGHADGVVRAEKADCVVLVARPRTATLLRKRYDCPVLDSNKPIDSLNDWVVTRDAAAAITRNAQIISRQMLCNEAERVMKGVNG